MSLRQHNFGEGSGRIWLTDVECIGSEIDLSDCRANSSGINSCTHAQDIGIRCPPGISSGIFLVLYFD